jgi:hypothetical protein
MPRLQTVTPQEFVKGVVKQLGDRNAQLMLKAYKITPDMDQNLFVTPAMRWMGDVVFDGKYCFPCWHCGQLLNPISTKS